MSPKRREPALRKWDIRLKHSILQGITMAPWIPLCSACLATGLSTEIPDDPVRAMRHRLSDDSHPPRGCNPIISAVKLRNWILVSQNSECHLAAQPGRCSDRLRLALTSPLHAPRRRWNAKKNADWPGRVMEPSEICVATPA